MANYQLRQVLPEDLLSGLCDYRQKEWEVPLFAFHPDSWSFCFLRGLRKLHLDGQRVWEVGVGPGLIIFLLRIWFLQARLFYSDLNPACTELAVRNLASAGISPSEWTVALLGGWDLITPPDGRQAPQVDYVVACIPQVPAPKGCDLSVEDHLAHYYDPIRYGSSWNAIGLGLNHTLLKKASHVLGQWGKAVLNLSGRPGLGRLQSLFQTTGFTPRVLHEEVIPQHPGTSVEPLASMEGKGQGDFEFFLDPQGSCCINARQAEKLRVQKREVFHKIYVIEGTMS